MGVKVTLSSEVSEWMQKHADLSVLNDKDREENRFLSFLRGEGSVTVKQVDRISQKLRIPFGYFFLTAPPVENIPLLDYRTVGSQEPATPSRDLIDTAHTMLARQAWASEELEADAVEPLSFIGSLAVEDAEVLPASQTIRELLGLTLDWYVSFKDVKKAIEDIRLRMEELGVLVMQDGIVGNNSHRPLDVGEFRAFALPDPYAPLIFINRRDSERARLFSLFHEFAHLCVNYADVYNRPEEDSLGLVSPTEKLCNAIAAELLAPERFFLEQWNAAQGLLADKMESLKRVFLCSKAVLARRALSTQVINIAEYREFEAQERTRGEEPQGASKKRGGDSYATWASRLSKTFVRMLADSVRRGNTTYSEACELTDLNRRTFAQLVRYVGGGDL